MVAPAGFRPDASDPSPDSIAVPVGVTLVTTILEVRAVVAAARTRGRRVSFVPTMGALHEGHLALVARAQALAACVVVSIFVNPLQFAAGEDLDRYPRTLPADLAALAALAPRGSAGAPIVVFAPTAAALYPDGSPATRVTAGPIADRFEGAVRPGHFDGVLTVVTKLLSVVGPDVAVFGRKDAQQLALVRQLVRDLNLPLTIEAVATAREPDGLARSSRNRALSAADWPAALTLSRSLAAAVAAAATGADGARAAGRSVFQDVPGAVLDYFDIVDPDTFLPVPSDAAGDALAIVAARVGTTRLIDNADIRLPPST